MQISRTDLLKIINTVLPGADKKPTGTLDGSDTMVLTEKSVYTYNGGTSISIPLPEGVHGFSWAFKAETLGKLVKALKGDLVELTAGENACTLSCGDTEAEFPALSIAVLAHVRNLEEGDTVEYHPAPSDFCDAVALCVQSGGKSDSTQRGLFIDKKGNMTSFDGSTRFNHYGFGGEEWPHQEFRLDEPQAIVLSKLGNISHISIGEDWAHFKSESGAVFHLRRAVHSGFVATGEKFCQILKSLDDAEKLFSGRLPVEIAEAVAGASVLAATSATDMGQLQMLSLDIGKDAITVKGESSAGKVRRKVKLVEPLESDPKIPQIMVYASFLVEASRKAMEFEFYRKPGSETNGILLFKSEKYSQIVSVALGK